MQPALDDVVLSKPAGDGGDLHAVEGGNPQLGLDQDRHGETEVLGLECGDGPGLVAERTASTCQHVVDAGRAVLQSLFDIEPADPRHRLVQFMGDGIVLTHDAAPRQDALGLREDALGKQDGRILGSLPGIPAGAGHRRGGRQASRSTSAFRPRRLDNSRQSGVIAAGEEVGYGG